VAAGNTFEAIGQEFLAKRKRENISPATLEKAEYHLRLLNAKLGNLPVAEITAPDVLAVLRPYDSKGRHETAKRLLQLAGRVFRYAVATARLVSDPTRDLKGAITAPKFKHFAAILEPQRVGELLRAIEGHEGGGLSLYALRLAPHVFVRPGELRQAEWSEIDFGAGVWTTLSPCRASRWRSCAKFTRPPAPPVMCSLRSAPAPAR
jgi:integrase